MKSDRNRYACRWCLEPRGEIDSMTNRGRHANCAETVFTQHYYDMKDRGSVAYKHYLECKGFVHIGRPRISPVPPKFTISTNEEYQLTPPPLSGVLSRLTGLIPTHK